MDYVQMNEKRLELRVMTEFFYRRIEYSPGKLYSVSLCKFCNVHRWLFPSV